MKICFRIWLAACVFLLLLPGAMGQLSPSTNPTKGIGATVTKDSVSGEVAFVRVYPNCAAAGAGVRPGDKIVAIDGKPVSALPLNDIKTLLSGGPQNNPYTATVKRIIKTSLGETEKQVDIPLTPATIELKTCLSGDCTSGEGKLQYNVSGFVYEGSFVDGYLVKGNIYYPNGRLFKSGTIKFGELDGPDGTLYYDAPDNLVDQQGTFLKGRLISGTFYYDKTNTKFEGAWDTAGKRHSKNFVISGPRFYFKGTYEHGVAIETERMTYKDGYYEGPLNNGRPEGKGQYVRGTYFYKGHFKNGLMEGKFRLINKTKSGRYESVVYFRGGVEE